MKQMKEMILTIAVIVFSAGIIYVVAHKIMNKQDVQIQKKVI
jgi:hypothetical protein